MINHPIHTLACVVAGEYVLAYQLLKVSLNLADIGITYALDHEAGTHKWNQYIEPLAQLCTAIENKQLTLRDAIKTSASIATGFYAQHKMFQGLGKIYATAQTKAIQFAKNYPSIPPEVYVTTPEGIVLRISTKKITTKNNANLSSIKSGFVNHLKTHCKEQGWNLSETGSFINGRYYTKHALERMAPLTKEVIKELEKRALKKGFLLGSKEFKAYVKPRGIPPIVVEDTIKNGIKLPGKNLNTINYITNELKVITNEIGDVVSVHKISS